jgi:hypothetical protein
MRKHLNHICVSLCLIALHKGTNQNTIGVTKITNVKLPHHKNPMTTYQMENEMSIVHHTIEQ